jgi:CheY-like chemotaxis protein
MKRESISTRGMSRRETSGASHPRVLVVESDDAARERIASVLRRTPLIVDEAGEGKRALELLEAFGEILERFLEGFLTGPPGRRLRIAVANADLRAASDGFQA